MQPVAVPSAPGVATVAVPIGAADGGDAVAIQNPGEIITATRVEASAGWTSSQPSKLLQHVMGVALLKPHSFRIEPPPGEGRTERAIYVQRVQDLASGEVLAEVRIESQDAKRGQRTVKITTPNGREIASVDKPPRATEHNLIDSPSTFTIDGVPYATFHASDSATAHGKLVHEGEPIGLRLEGRRSLKKFYCSIAFVLSLLVVVAMVVFWAVDLGPVAYCGFYLIILILAIAAVAGTKSPSLYGVVSLDGSVVYPPMYAKAGMGTCRMGDAADDGTKYISFAPRRGYQPLEGRLRFAALLLLVAYNTGELLPSAEVDMDLGEGSARPGARNV